MCWSSCMYTSKHPAKPNMRVPSTSVYQGSSHVLKLDETSGAAASNVLLSLSRSAVNYRQGNFYDYNLLVSNLFGLLLCFLFDWILSNKLGAL